MATFAELEARIDELERKLKAGNLPLDSLPMKALTQKLNQIQNPEGDDFIIPHTAGPDSLAAVPAAKISRNSAFALPAAAHTCIPMDTINWQQGVQINLATQPTRITIVTPGIYYMQAFTFISGAYTSVGITVSGKLIVSQEGWGGAGAVLLSTSTIEPLRAGDYIEMTNYSNAAINTGWETGAAFGGCVSSGDRDPHLAVAYLSYREGL